MSKPSRKRPPKGNAKGGSITDKDDAATATQADERRDLLAWMRAKNQSQTNEGSQTPPPS